MADEKRAYWLREGKYCHVYIVEQFEQAVLGGGIRMMASVKLSKKTKEAHLIEYDKLLFQRPKKVRA